MWAILVFFYLFKALYVLQLTLNLTRFLIQMRTVSGGDATGKFHINNDDEKIKYLTCKNDQVLCVACKLFH